MDDILQDLEVAFKAISSISVSGDAVDAVALARTKLRKVYSELSKPKEEVSSDD